MSDDENAIGAELDATHSHLAALRRFRVDSRCQREQCAERGPPDLNAHASRRRIVYIRILRSGNGVDHHPQTPGMVTRGGTESWMHSGCVGNGAPHAVVFVDVSRGGVGVSHLRAGRLSEQEPGKMEAPGTAP